MQPCLPLSVLCTAARRRFWKRGWYASMEGRKRPGGRGESRLRSKHTPLFPLPCIYLDRASSSQHQVGYTWCFCLSSPWRLFSKYLTSCRKARGRGLGGERMHKRPTRLASGWPGPCRHRWWPPPLPSQREATSEPVVACQWSSFHCSAACCLLGRYSRSGCVLFHSSHQGRLDKVGYQVALAMLP